MEITSAMIKALREKTGAGMMDCKRALESSGGNMDTAIEYLRKKGEEMEQVALGEQEIACMRREGERTIETEIPRVLLDALEPYRS